jgi:DNA polymerase-3 subunit gamma/tau
VLATTEAHKVPPTIVSRCQRFDFRRIPFAETRQQLARIAESEGMQIEPAVFERLALVARGGLRDALSLLDQLSAFAVGPIDMGVARAALSLPSIEAVRGAIDGMTRRDPSTVMAVISDAAEGGADLRLFAEELVVHLRALLLLRTGADARLSDELPEAEVAWLRERAPGWSVRALIQLVQTLSEALARTRDAAQFQVQTEVALLEACDVESVAAPVRAEPVVAAVPSAAVPSMEPADPTPTPTPAPTPTPEPDSDLAARWPDVIEQVKQRNGLVASILSSAQPLRIEETLLVVAFSTDFNRKTAEKKINRDIIETAFARVYGTAYRLKGMLSEEQDGAPSLHDDPVINYAVRTFGGQPRRLD